MSTSIPELNVSERQLVSQILLERYGHLVALQSAEVELQLDTASGRLTLCPALYWSERGAEFIVCKIAENRFRCQFFYSDDEQFGTGRDNYNSLGDCVLTLLQVQADHASTRARSLSGVGEAEAQGDGPDYNGPLVI